MNRQNIGPVGDAFVRSATLFLGALLLFLFGSLVRRVFDGVWRANWHEAFGISLASSLCAFVFFLVTGLAEQSATSKRTDNPQPIFLGAAWLRGVCFFVILFAIATAIGTYREGDPAWVTALSGIFFCLGFFTWPRAISFRNGEIRQRRLFFGTRRISYNQIETVGCISSSPEITVFGRDGTRIVHTSSHADPVGFIDALHRIAGKEVAFPEELLEVRR